MIIAYKLLSQDVISVNVWMFGFEPETSWSTVQCYSTELNILRVVLALYQRVYILTYSVFPFGYCHNSVMQLYDSLEMK